MRRLAAMLAIGLAAPAHAATRTQTFSADPGWSGSANRPAGPCVTRANRFGVTPTGAVGGTFARSIRPAGIAQPIAPVTLDDPLAATGTLTVPVSRPASGVLFGWHNARSRNWRTNDSLMFRLDGENTFVRVLLEYGTHTWRAGGARYVPGGSEVRLRVGRTYVWRLEYDPGGGVWGLGRLRMTIRGRTLRLSLPPVAREDGARFDRFGFLGQMIEGPPSSDDGIVAFVDGLTVGGAGVGAGGWVTRRSAPFTDCTANARQDFGYAPVSVHAGGRRGEAGGTLAARDVAAPPESAYGDRIGPLRLDRPLAASGRVALRRGSSDGDAFLGFYRARSIASCRASGAPRNLVAVHIGGPSRVGFLFAPLVRTARGTRVELDDAEDVAPRILPDGSSHRWSLRYTPAAEPAEGGTLEVTLDDAEVTLPVPGPARRAGVALNRFGLRGRDCGGHGVEIYIDDVTYTSA